MSENHRHPPTPPVRAGLPTIAWLGIGCGSFVIIALIVIGLGTTWFKRSGDVNRKEMALSDGEIADKRHKPTIRKSAPTPSHSKQVTEMPSWVPRPPNAKETEGSNHSSDANHVSGLFVANSDQSVDALGNFFVVEALKINLSKSADTTFNTAGAENRSLTFEGEDRRLNVTLLSIGTGEVQVSVFYSAKNTD